MPSGVLYLYGKKIFSINNKINLQGFVFFFFYKGEVMKIENTRVGGIDIKKKHIYTIYIRVYCRETIV